MITKMLEDNIIETTQSEWASPIVINSKKDDSLQFCVNYGKSNALTKQNSSPTFLMDKYIDSLGETTIFSALDPNSGSWHNEIDELDQDKTAFTSNHELYRFKRMPFGL